MIFSKDRTTLIEGTAREVVMDLTSILVSFRESLSKEYKMTEEEILQVVGKCGQIAFMDKREILKELDDLEEGDDLNEL